MDQPGRAPGPVRRGRCAEDIAARFLELRGHRILDRNRRAGAGEVDLLTRDGDCLVFVEVRLRARGARVGPAGTIGRRKWGRLLSCARELARREEFRWRGRRLRIDAVLLTADGARMEILHLVNLTGPAHAG